MFLLRQQVREASKQNKKIENKSKRKCSESINKGNRMISIKFVMTLLAAINLSEGQIVGEGSKEVTNEEHDYFKSQVLVETLESWLPEDERLRTEYYMKSINFPQDDFAPVGSGTILNNKWILTAAHLFHGNMEATIYKSNKINLVSTVRRVRIVFGKLAKQPQNNVREVERVIKHHNYDDENVKDKGDIALLQLRNLFNFVPYSPDLLQPRFAPADLPIVHEKVGMDCRMSGWGRQSGNEHSNTLRWAKTRIVEHTDPARALYYKNTDLFAVGTPKNNELNRNYLRAAIANGDSGGGLLCQHEAGTYVFGVAAGSLKNKDGKDYPLHLHGTVGYPSLYTSVHYNLKWINEQMKANRPLRKRPGENLVSTSVMRRKNVFFRFFNSVRNFFGRRQAIDDHGGDL